MNTLEDQLAAYGKQRRENQTRITTDDLMPRPVIVIGDASGTDITTDTRALSSASGWWAGAVAAAMALVMGAIVVVTWIPSSDESAIGSPDAPSTSSTTELSTSGGTEPGAAATVLALGRHTVTVDGVTFSFEMPSTGWEAHGEFLMAKDFDGDQAAEAIILFTAFRDGAHASLCPELPPGRLPEQSDIDTVAQSFASHGSTIPNLSEEYSVGGLPGRFVEVDTARNDGVDGFGCDPGFFYGWEPPADGASWTVSERGDVIDTWLVEVDGVMLVIVAETRGPSSAIEAKPDIFGIVDSIRFPLIPRMASADYVIDLNTGATTLLPAAIRSLAPSSYAVSPDGSTLAFVAPDSEGLFQLFTAGIDGAGIRQITHSPFEAGSPAWSPDGTTLAYVESGGVFLLNVDTGETTQIPGVVARCCLQFAPDGSSILYTSTGQGSVALWTVSIDGGQNTPLIGVDQGIEHAAGGSMSPDGSHVTFLGSKIGGPGALLFIADVIDPQPQVLHDMDAGDCGTGNPSGVWSPDGNSIVCSRGPDAVIVIDIATGATTHAYLGDAAIWLDDHTLLVEERGN